MEKHTSTERSGLVTESCPSTREQALRQAFEQIEKASAEGKLSKKSSPVTMPTSTLSSPKPLRPVATIDTTEESGEKQGKFRVPAKISSLATHKLTELLRAQGDQADHARTELIQRSNKGDEEAYAVISKDYEHIYGELSIMGRTLLKSMVKSFVGEERRMSQILVATNILGTRDQYAGPTPTPLEKLLAERIALCQATVECLEGMYFQTPNMNVHVGIMHQHRISLAQSRLIQAIKALAQVRKFQLPNVQVNIGEKQVNVA